MFISDNWLITYGGFKRISEVLPAGEGRGLFNSIRGGFLLAVVSTSVYRFDTAFVPIFIGKIGTLTGDVYIDENLSSQICIVDGENAYIYNYSIPAVPGPNFALQPLPFFPSYVSYHNTFFLFGSSPASTNSQFWYAYNGGTGLTITLNTQFALQTKPDSALVVERLPGRGNNVLVVGSTVAEVWTQVGGTENYRRVQSFNIDYGVTSISTLAANEEQICYLAQNENNSPTLFVTDGSSTKIISTDGIDHLLDEIQFPGQSTAFFFRQDGHLFYQLTFYNPADNLTLIYDFTTSLFFHASDENLNYHPARKVAFFNEKTYFISLNEGSIYQMDTTLLTYDYSTDPASVGFEIPRIRICKTIRKKNADRFRIGQFTFTIEQGVVPQNAPTGARVDMSISKNDGQSFGSVVSRELNPSGLYRNQLRFWRMGQANSFIIQLRFYGFQRFVCSNGICEIY